MAPVVAVAFAAATVAVGLGWGGDETTLAIADWSAFVAAIVGLVAALRARRVAVGRHGWGWLAPALGWWALGEALWSIWEVVLGQGVPYPSVADVAYLAAVPFAVVGLVRFVPKGHGLLGARSVLDGCLVAASTLVVGWEAALGPAIRAADEPVLTHLVSIAYPLTDVVMAALAVVVVQWGGSQARTSLRLLAAGFVVMAIADTAFTWMIAQDTYTGTDVITMLWPASYLLLAGAARVEVQRPLAASSTRPSLWALLLPYLPLGAALAVAVVHVADGRPLGPFVSALTVALIGLVLARQGVTAWDLRATIGALAEREAELARMALHDSLTGLANRARFGARLEEAVASLPLRPAVVYIDLDGFKAVNDAYGHAVGDQLLVAAARRLEACATESMLVARLGGDEFVVLVEDGHADAIRMAERVLDSFALPFENEGASIRFQASVGVASAPVDGSPEEAVRRADAAMYVAKTTGKGRAVDYPDETILTR